MEKSIKQPIGCIKFWRPTDDWYTLDPSQRQSYLDDFERVINKAKQQGCRLLGTYKCRGQSAWSRFEMWEFPELQMLIDLSNDLERIGHFQFFEEDHTVGRKYERSGEASSWVI